MSAPPGTTTPPSSNTNVYIMGGAILGFFVLCAGLLTQSLITLKIVTLNADYAYKAGATQRSPDSGSPDTSSRPGPGEESQPATELARMFMKDLQSANYSNAYGRTSENYQSQEDLKAFRERIQAAKIFTAYQSLSLTRAIGDKTGFETFSGRVKGPYGEGRFGLNVVQEGDGTWKVDSFGRD